MRRARITVVGGANMDLAGRPTTRLRPGDSNPGSIRLSPGGVGRNIAHNLAILGQQPSLICALGDDLFGAALLQSCAALGIDASRSLVLSGARSPSYLYVTDEQGEMRHGIADMELVSRLTPDFLAGCLDAVNGSDALVVDANLPEESLRFLAENCRVPLYADPVSAAKAPRLSPVLPRLRAIKPNRLEAAALTGRDDPAEAAEVLLARGVGRVIVSLGAAGLLAAEGSERLYLPALPCTLRGANGAGDAAMAAFIWADLQGWPLRRCAELAQKAGALSAASEETIDPALLQKLSGE